VILKRFDRGLEASNCGGRSCAPRGNRTPNPLIKSQPGSYGMQNPVISQERWGSARAKTAKLAGAETITQPDMRPRVVHYVNLGLDRTCKEGPAVTPTPPQTPAEHHYQQAERTLATLGSLAATPEEATREAAAALVHAVLAIASLLIGQPDTEHWGSQR
jgi:hypothetical protein